MSNVWYENSSSVKHRVVIPALEPWGGTRRDLYEGLSLMDRKYRELHGLKPGRALEDDAYRAHLKDDQIVLSFEMPVRDVPATETVDAVVKLALIRNWCWHTEEGKAAAEILKLIGDAPGETAE